MTVPLLFPDPVQVANLISWTRAVDELSTGPEAQRAQLLERYGASGREVLRAETPGTCPTAPMSIVLIGASRERKIDVLVPSRDGARHFQLRPDCWSVRDGVLDPAQVARHGRLLVIADLLPRVSLEAELAGQPLFLPRRQMRNLLRQRNPATAAVQGSAQRVIHQHQSAYPNRAMRREDFVAAVTSQHPGLSAREARNQWEELAPAEWKRRGRKR